MKKRKAVPKKIVFKTKADTGPNSQPWEPDHQYECNTCHGVVVPPTALTDLRCTLYRKGIQCEGKLVRFGKGAGRGAHLRKEVQA